MRKASKIILIVGGIITIVTSLVLLGVGFIFKDMGTSESYYNYTVEALKNGNLHSSFPGTPEEQATQVQLMYMIYFSVLMYFAIAGVIAGTYAICINSSKNKALFIVDIILGALSITAVLIVGGILGLVALNRQNNQAV
jgi:hypothetical protein